MLERQNRKQVSTLEIFLFIFSMSFAPQYLPIDVRPVIYFFWILVSLSRGGYFNDIIITRYVRNTLIFLLLISIYSAIVVLTSSSGDHYVYIRYIRAFLALSVIILYISNSTINIKKLINSFVLILFLHSLIIIVEIILPEIRELMYPFSGSSRKFYAYRANGLVNSYDLAGIYTNFGLLLSSVMYIQSRQKKYLIISLVSILATIFTSRLSIIAMIFILMFILKKSNENRVVIFKVFISIIFIITGTIGIGLWTITTDVFPLMRSYIFSYSWADELYLNIIETYSDDDVGSLLTNHFVFGLESVQTFLFGKGLEGPADPGYSKIYNSIGLIGIVLITFYYLYQWFYINNFKYRNFNSYYYLVYISLIYILLTMLVGNFKILFFFSTSLFELMSILIISYEFFIRQKNGITKKGNELRL
ncbi:hypothetical protein [Paraliobacillus quinghaiensis]|nr:hypothetical protein [Paraliobacillus quinghaiensis]